MSWEATVLESLGLSAATEMVYRTMLTHPTLGIDDLASLTGLHPVDVHTALDALTKLALLSRSGEAPGELRAISPEVGLAALLARAEADVAKRQREVEATRAAITAIVDAYSAGRVRHTLIRLENAGAVRARLDELTRLARFECLSFSPLATHRHEAIEAAKPLHRHTLERGVTVRAVYQHRVRNNRQTLAYAHWLVDVGGQVRTVSTVPIQMMIVDRELALLPLDVLNPRLGAVEVDSPGILAALCALFERVWAMATPFTAQTAKGDNALTPSERNLLSLLEQGHTDESAARNLGLSARTTQRMAADLMGRLAAVSRFQAGSNAVRRGWL